MGVPLELFAMQWNYNLKKLRQAQARNAAPALKHINKIATDKSMPQEGKDLAVIANTATDRMSPNVELSVALKFILCAMEALERADKTHKEKQKNRTNEHQCR